MKKLLKAIIVKAEHYALILAEYSFAGIVVGGLLSNELPFDRSLIIVMGIISSVLLFVFSAFFHTLNPKEPC